MFRLGSSLPLLYLKTSLSSNLMSKHYAVPKETEGINVWLHCCVFRAIYILVSYLANGEGETVLLVPAFNSLDPRWWESSTVK